jgi:apoptosis-inducing factor 3
MEAVFGAEIGDLVRRVHEQNGVRFHLGTTAAAIDSRGVDLSNGARLDADRVIGIGVRPLTTLAETAGIAVNHSVTVDGYLETSVSDIWAAGDIARWARPADRRGCTYRASGRRRTAGPDGGRNMLGRRERFDAVPFFWTQQYDLTLSYIGHARQWDRVEIDGSIDDRDATVSYRRGGRKLAAVTIGRDRDGLAAEFELEQKIATSG